MTRLDVWLVKNHFFSSRQTAKRAIRAGLVTVNGIPGKPSMIISNGQLVEVSPEASERPLGYEKLYSIDESFQFQIVRPGIRALDIGSSAGGFLLYLAERQVHVTGIEISSAHSDRLSKIEQKNPNVSVIIGDAFLLDPSQVVSNTSIDLLLVDVTTDPEGTLRLISIYTPVLKAGGWLLAAFKRHFSDAISEHISDLVTSLGYQVVKYIALSRFREEFHLIAKRQ